MNLKGSKRGGLDGGSVPTRRQVLSMMNFKRDEPGFLILAGVEEP
jgi:hypothetical protein